LKNDEIVRVAKRSNSKTNPDAYRVLAKSVDEFKLANRYNAFYKVRSLSEQLHGNFGIVKEIVSGLENLRISLSLRDEIFYRLVAEFIRTPNGRQYIPVKHIFSKGWTSEEFMIRVHRTLSWICTFIHESPERIEEITSFQKEINKRSEEHTSELQSLS
jgi:hypothetical protein